MLPRKSSRGLEMVASAGKGSMLLSFIVNNPGKAPDELESSRHWKLVSVFVAYEESITLFLQFMVEQFK